MRRRALRHKHFVLDESKIKRAQKLLGARTEREAIEGALDELISERKREAMVRRAHFRFLRSGIQIRDAYGRLDDRA